MKTPLRLITFLAVVLLGTTAYRSTITQRSSASVLVSPSITGLHVQGNHLLNSSGQVIQLLGVDYSGTEYSCIQNHGIFDGPSDAASVQAIASWHTNAVRVPLNEDCWLGINGAPAAYSGANYQQAIGNYVTLLNQNGLVAILDLHWSAPGTAQSTGQEAMPDQDHAPAFWSSVATYFKSNGDVVFDLYNEPYPDSDRDTTAAWQCLRDGGTCPGMSFQAAGMQELVTTVRNTGATNVIMIPGVNYANALSQWLTYKPSDPQNNLAASWHSYSQIPCNTQTCWDSTVAPVAQQVPVIAGEIGENDCAHGYIDTLMSWMDSHGASYVAWDWGPFSCGGYPALVTDYNGTPTNYGVGYKNHLATLASAPPGAGLVVSPNPDQPYATLNVTGTAFGASESVKVYLDSTTSTAIATPSTNTSGTFTAAPKLAKNYGGAHSVIAVGQTSGLSATTPLSISSVEILSPTSGAVGATVSITDSGFGQNETVKAYWQPGNILLGSKVTGSLGSLTSPNVITFTVPMSATGTYTVKSIGQTSGITATALFTKT